MDFDNKIFHDSIHLLPPHVKKKFRLTENNEQINYMYGQLFNELSNNEPNSLNI